MNRIEVIRVAGEAKVDPRTVQRALNGERVQAVVREAVANALDRCGHPDEAAKVRAAGG